MPAEWWPHRRCWMAWPCRGELWGDRLGEARRIYAEVARAIAAFEPVTMIARPDLTADASLECGPGVTVLPLPHDDSWVRDTGPTFLIDGGSGLAGVNWRFNAWGEIHDDYAQDAALARAILNHVGAELFESTLTLEGGAVHVDGEGTGLVCTPAVLDPARNPGISAEEVEAELNAALAVDKVIWLPNGLGDDETKGHIDNVACFARPGVVLTLDPATAVDADRPGLEANLEILKGATDAAGRALEVQTLPLPRPRERDDGRRLTQSYINFYIANAAVIVPSFDDPADAEALKRFTATFPDREVVEIEATALLHGGGGIHCITQQEPRPTDEVEGGDASSSS